MVEYEELITLEDLICIRNKMDDPKYKDWKWASSRKNIDDEIKQRIKQIAKKKKRKKRTNRVKKDPKVIAPELKNKRIIIL